MTKRKIEAEVAVDVTGAAAVKDLEEQTEKLAAGIDVPIGVEVDESKLAKFERELDDLNLDSSRELRIEFRGQVLQQQIRNTLRDLERLDDPIEISARTQDLERAQTELRDLAELAERKYEVDVRVDTKGTARQAADEIGRMGVNAEGLQRGIGPLRGFTDELGGASAAGGVAANAFVDAGEAIEIFGGQLGISEKTLGRASIALGAVGIAAGIGLTAWQKYKEGQENARIRVDETTQALRDQIPVLDELADAAAEAAEKSTDPYIRLAQVFREQLDDDELEKFRDTLDALGLSFDDLDEAVAGLDTDRVGYFAEQLTRADVDPGQARRIAELLASFDNFQDVAAFADVDLEPQVLELRTFIEALYELEDVAASNRVGTSLTDFLKTVRTDGGEAGRILRGVTEALSPDASDLDVYTAYIAKLDELGLAGEEAGEGVERGASRARDAAESIGGVFQDVGDRIAGVVDDVRTAAGEAAEQITRVEQALLDIDTDVSAERQLLNLAESFDRVAEKRLAAAEARGTAEEEKAVRSFRLEQLRLIDDTVDYLRTVEGIPAEKITRIGALIDSGALSAAEAEIAALSGDRVAKLTIDITPKIDRAFETISFRVQPDAAPQQVATVFSPPAQQVIVYNPPGTPASTAEQYAIDLYRNGNRGPF